ncbi:3,4-dihydroxy-2-butanone-4-phosphate synthase [Rhizobium sp. RHZ02]|uniref:3,4-dihydroxy-2-butanone-4-phosphate synthase n=1 Tax=Rhizobium sp. RHZ02 TaxID=2769306 RepID=UPI00177F38CB|nr:3,4-dihydroxy-2-butanone-4-phosphate synthase [Rhizobium sp. RHZ02]MBD9453578.1 3,4-dihydroxy-2-butanone-4-phosphate synthase [Rhizobium sp. RHZ02]
MSLFGVLFRPGHTGAAVDLSRIAGLAPSGVICEVATKAHFPDLEVFAKRHGLQGQG